MPRFVYPPQAAPLLEECCPTLAELAAAQRLLPCWTVMAQLAEPAQLGFEAAFVNHRPQQQQAGAGLSGRHLARRRQEAGAE